MKFRMNAMNLNAEIRNIQPKKRTLELSPLIMAQQVRERGGIRLRRLSALRRAGCRFVAFDVFLVGWFGSSLFP